jgi:two-component system, chemotaxis family, chemotaxis protein CheY
VKVLTVDDSRTIRAVVAHYLAPLGLTVLQAADGAEGLEILRAARPDLALLDAMMPNLGGLELMAQKAKDPLIAHIPVIMLTAGADQEFVLRCLRLGAKGYILKPFEKKTLIQKVCKLLNITPPDNTQDQTQHRGPVVLAVDRDEKELSNLMEFLLEGCDLLTALDQRQALRLFREHHPEAVWLDISQEPDALRAFVGALNAEGKPSLVALVPRNAPPSPIARELGIKLVLQKPLIRLEVREFAARTLGIFQRYLVTRSGHCILSVPPEPQVRTGEWLTALDGEVHVGLDRAATQGVVRLVIDCSSIKGPADVGLVSGIVKVSEIASKLNIQTVLVVPAEDTLKSMTNYQDLKGFRCVRDLRDAVEGDGDPQAVPRAA